MEAAMIDAPETVVSAPTTTIYLARRAELVLVHTPVRPIWGAGGQKQDDTKGKRIAFREGRFDCPLEGEYRFDNGETIAADELRAWLDGHRLNGDSAEGFWKVDPTAPAPTPAELQSIVDLAMDLDIGSLQETLRTELEGWQRDPVIAMARRAIEKVQGILDAQGDVPDQAEAEAEALREAEKQRQAQETLEAANRRAAELEQRVRDAEQREAEQRVRAENAETRIETAAAEQPAAPEPEPTADPAAAAPTPKPRGRRGASE